MAERDDLVVTVGKEMARKDDWVVTIKDDLQRMDTIRTAEKQHWDKRSIYKVPASVVTDLNMEAYKPQFVSFGPYHHGEHHLMPMEEHKRRALLHFLKRSNKPLESYLNALAEVTQSLKDSYESLDLVWESDTDRFLRMMILDGCFMLEVLRTQTADQKITETVNDYVANDPIFSNHGKLHIVPYIRRDMLMLENQLPMLLLTTILDEETKQDEEFVNKLMLQFCSGNTRFAAYPYMGKCLHLLDVHRKILLVPDTRRAIRGHQRKSWWHWNILSCLMAYEAGTGDEIIRSAMNIYEAGISFKKSTSRSLQDISFEGGKLSLPPIVVDDTTESMFLNLIAFERFHIGVGNEVTSYLFFMDSIIDSAKDVSLLHDKGIIQNALGSDRAVAKLFNNISKNATLEPASSLGHVLRRVDEHCRQPWNKWRALLSHTYFTFLATKPWAIISVSAALLLYAFTILQTVYTVLSYYKPNDSPSPSMP